MSTKKRVLTHLKFPKHNCSSGCACHHSYLIFWYGYLIPSWLLLKIRTTTCPASFGRYNALQISEDLRPDLCFSATFLSPFLTAAARKVHWFLRISWNLNSRLDCTSSYMYTCFHSILNRVTWFPVPCTAELFCILLLFLWDGYLCKLAFYQIILTN